MPEEADIPEWVPDLAPEFVEPVVTQALALIKRDSPSALVWAKKDAALPPFKEYLDVRKNKPHYPFVVAQADDTTFPEKEQPEIGILEGHTITLFIGHQGQDETLVGKQGMRYVRAVDSILRKAIRTKELVALIPKDGRRGGFRAFIQRHKYGQVTYDSTNYTFLSSITLGIGLVEK